MNPISATRAVAGFARKKLSARKYRKRILARPNAFNMLPTGNHRYRVAFYFADGMINAYQVRQWYEPLQKLNQYMPLVIIARNPKSAVMLEQESGLPVFFGRTIGDIENMMDTQSIDLVFYANQNIRNFQMMRFNAPAHVFISHGESEKAYMWSNQLKAYDWVFAAGDAAKERLAKNLLGFDVQERTKLIGRPQIDVDHVAPLPINPNLPTVLYAPTWEGDRPSMSYGSVASHGTALIRSLVQNGDYNIIFRPHPRSGINSPQYRTAVESIRTILAKGSNSSSATFYFDESPEWGWQWSVSDICITDVSAVAYDFLATGKPLIITSPVNPHARIDETPALKRVPSMSTIEAQNAAAIVGERLELKDDLFDDLVRHYFGDTGPGASMDRFIRASLQVIAERSAKKQQTLNLQDGGQKQ